MNDGARRTRSGLILQPCREYVPLGPALEEYPAATGPAFRSGAALAAALASLLAFWHPSPPPVAELGIGSPAEPLGGIVAPAMAPIPSESIRPQESPLPLPMEGPASNYFEREYTSGPMIEREPPKKRLSLIASLSGLVHIAYVRNGFAVLALSQSSFWRLPSRPPAPRGKEPLVFDLKGGGVRASERWIRYDLAGDGTYQTLHDIASTNGVLVLDPRHSGVPGKNGRELFGDKTDLEGRGRAGGFKDGFEALDALVRKAEREGVLPRGTRELGRLGPAELAALGRAYGLAMRLGSLLGKAVPLAEAGVSEIILSDAVSRLARNFDGQGDDAARREGARFKRANGSLGAYEAVFFKVSPAVFEKLSFAPWQGNGRAPRPPEAFVVPALR